METTILGLIASALVVIAFLPQVIKCWKTKETKSISFIEKSGGQKRLEVPGSWLFDSIREDISEHDELNLEAYGLQESGFESISLIGAVPEKKDGWMHLIIFCKLEISSYKVKNLWSDAPDHEYNNLIFVKSNPQSLAGIFSCNVYPSLFGGYHAYFQAFHPELL